MKLRAWVLLFGSVAPSPTNNNFYKAPRTLQKRFDQRSLYTMDYAAQGQYVVPAYRSIFDRSSLMFMAFAPWLGNLNVCPLGSPWSLQARLSASGCVESLVIWFRFVRCRFSAVNRPATDSPT